MGDHFLWACVKRIIGRPIMAEEGKPSAIATGVKWVAAVGAAAAVSWLLWDYYRRQRIKAILEGAMVWLRVEGTELYVSSNGLVLGPLDPGGAFRLVRRELKDIRSTTPAEEASLLLRGPSFVIAAYKTAPDFLVVADNGRDVSLGAATSDKALWTVELSRDGRAQIRSEAVSRPFDRGVLAVRSDLPVDYPLELREASAPTNLVLTL
jgi:hypothetical protein